MFSARLLGSVLLLAVSLHSQVKYIPFSMKGGEAGGEADLSGELLRTAGKRGFPAVRDGHLFLGGKRARLWGTNLCFDACFPAPGEAETLARRLAAFGIGCVRLHHMDARSIWGKSKDHLHPDPAMVERLDRLVAAFEARGIRVDVNLHVSRWFGPRDGFPGDRRLRPRDDKGLDNFEPRMIELQKKYARDLLRHVNPFTKTPYAVDPAVVFVEISNEDSLFSQWGRGALDTLPQPYASTFRKLWNDWLKKKYGTTKELHRAWGTEGTPPGRELLPGPERGGTPSWKVEKDRNTRFSWKILPDSGPGGGPEGVLLVRRMGLVPWHPQVSSPPFAVEGGAPYTLVFRGKADPPRKVRVVCMMAHSPWKHLGLSARVALGRDWREVRLVFQATGSDPRARISFSGLGPGRFEWACFSLRKGAPSFPPGLRDLEEGRVPVLKRSFLPLSRKALEDFTDFIWDTEKRYWWGMYSFLKKDLGVKGLVSGTQLGYSPVHIQAGLDYLDTHAYWHHPRFPGKPWDRRNWWVQEEALVNRPVEFLGGLAARRVAGKPFTLSEYNHPQPNRYGAEGFPMIAAFAAFQDWDGVFFFAWSHNRDYTPGRITRYFDVKGDPAKLVHMAACSHLFARGDVRPGRVVRRIPFGADLERSLVRRAVAGKGMKSIFSLVPPGFGLLGRVELDPAGRGKKPFPAPPEAGDRWVSDTGELTWNLEIPGAGFFTADTRRTKVFTGFPAGRKIRMGRVKAVFGKLLLGWATLTLTCLDGEGFDRPGRILLAATGLEKNTGGGVEFLEGGRVTLGGHWGKAPVLCEGVPAKVVLPYPASKIRCFALDERGRKKAEIRLHPVKGGALLRIGKKWKTLWYLLENLP